jgi:hypothetical protein
VVWVELACQRVCTWEVVYTCRLLCCVYLEGWLEGSRSFSLPLYVGPARVAFVLETRTGHESLVITIITRLFCIVFI